MAEGTSRMNGIAIVVVTGLAMVGLVIAGWNARNATPHARAMPMPFAAMPFAAPERSKTRSLRSGERTPPSIVGGKLHSGGGGSAHDYRLGMSRRFCF